MLSRALVIYLPYIFPYIFEYWLIPNNCTLISSMVRQLIHNDRVVGNVFQSWQCHYCQSCQLKEDLCLHFVLSCHAGYGISVLEHNVIHQWHKKMFWSRGAENWLFSSYGGLWPPKSRRSRGMLLQEILDFHIFLEWFWCILSTLVDK